MSHVAYNFLSESFLFQDDLVSDQFASITDSQLRAELERYRDYILRSRTELENEAAGEDSRLVICFETVEENRPTIDLLKQCGLYFDLAVVDDPLFALTLRPHPQGEAAAQLLGYEQHSLDRQEVARAALFLRTLTPMVAGGFLKFLPFSLQHEPGPGLPVRYSETLFAEGVPEEFRELFKSQIEVHSLQKSERGWSYRVGDPVVPSRGICVEFRGLRRTYVYHLFASKAVNFDEVRRVVHMESWVPDEPPEPEAFQTWVSQSINQSAESVVRHVAKDVANAAWLRSLLLTTSPLLAAVLAADPRTTTDLKADMARLALQVEVPVLTNVTLDDLMRVRADDRGEAFERFRRALQRMVREFRRIEDRSELVGKLREASHELAELQVEEVEASIRSVKRDLKFEGLIGAASLAAILPTGGTSLLSLIAMGVEASKTINHYRGEVKAHPAYFLWRLQKRAKKKDSSNVLVV